MTISGSVQTDLRFARILRIKKVLKAKHEKKQVASWVMWHNFNITVRIQHSQLSLFFA